MNHKETMENIDYAALQKAARVLGRTVRKEYERLSPNMNLLMFWSLLWPGLARTIKEAYLTPDGES